MSVRHAFWSMLLLTWCYAGSARAEESSKLPDHYAEVVLRVEGMT